MAQRVQAKTKEILDTHEVVPLTDKPGLGIDIDMDQLDAAHRLFNKFGGSKRDDARAMQSLIPGWAFDPKKPSLVRP